MVESDYINASLNTLLDHMTAAVRDEVGRRELEKKQLGLE